MATSSTVVTNQQLPDTIATPKDFTSSGFGSPDAVLLFSSIANLTANPFVTGTQFTIGFWDGTNDYSAGISALSGIVTTNTKRTMSLTDIAALPSINQSNHNLRASASAITDGFRATLTEDNTTLNRYASAVFLKGLTNKYVGYHDMDNTTNANNITAPGFKPDLVLFLGIGNATALDETAGIFSFGAAHNNSSDVISQGCVSVSSKDNVNTTVSNSYASNTKCLAEIYDDVVDRTFTASDFDASGFSITQSAVSTNRILYIALEFADPDDVYVGIVDSATGTGNTSYTGTGFTPQTLILGQTMCTAVDTLSDEGFFAVGVSSGSGNQQCLDYVDEDGVTTPDAESQRDASNILRIKDDTPAVDAVAALSSFDSDGWTLNYSDGSASARKMLAIAFGEAPAGAPFLGGGNAGRARFM